MRPYSRWLAPFVFTAVQIARSRPSACVRARFALPGLIRIFVIGALAAFPLACAEVIANTGQVEVAAAMMCPVGSQGCACTSGGGCDPGLYCDGGVCVGGDYGTGDSEYMFEDDMLEAEMLAPAPMAEPMRAVESLPGIAAGSYSRAERRAERNAGRKFGKARTTSADTAAPAESTMGPTPQPVGGLAPPDEEPRDPAEPVESDSEARQVIYTASMILSVFDIDATAELLEDMPRRYGGWIESRNNYQITLRIKADRLFEAMAQLEEIGIVLDKSLYAEDVTAEYVDLESRIRVLEQIVAQLEALLAKAKTVEEALRIRVELDRMRIELEAARVRMRALSEQIDFSTLTVLLAPRGTEVLPSSNDPFPWVNEMGVEATEWR